MKKFIVDTGKKKYSVEATDAEHAVELVKMIVRDSVNAKELEKAVFKLSKDALQEIAYPGMRGPVGCPKDDLLDDVINGDGFDALLKGNKSHPEAKRIIEELNDRNIKVKGVTDSMMNDDEERWDVIIRRKDDLWVVEYETAPYMYKFEFFKTKNEAISWAKRKGFNIYRVYDK